MDNGPVEASWLGRVPYREALRLQRARREGVIAGRAGDTLWLLEHPRVITLGRRGGLGGPMVGIEVVSTERGGLATWHGPGQLVGYLIADVGRLGHGVRSTVCAIEKGLSAWLGSVGIQAEGRDGLPGVWVGDRKIASLGLHFRRGVSLHGFALNLDPDLSEFATFNPCGLNGVEMTSVSRESGFHARPESVWADVAAAVNQSIARGARNSSLSACDA